MNIPDKHDLTGKVAVVTGGGGVLCSTLARALANLDYTVLRLALRPEENGEERGKLALEIKVEGTATEGGVTVPVSLTVTFHDDIERLINTGLNITRRNNQP